MTKLEFLERLEKELARFGVVDKSEIIADFEQHFADSKNLGTNEAEICAKLGDISEIAKQYAEEEIFPAVAVDTGVNSTPPPPVQNESFNSQNADISGFDNIAAQSANPSANNHANQNNRWADGADSGDTPTPYENSGIRIDFGQFKKNTSNTPPPQTNFNAPPPPVQTHFSTAQNPPPQNVKPLSQEDNINSYYGPNGETNPPPRSYSDYANSGYKINSENFNVSGLVTVILVDIFVLSWAMVAFFGVTVGLLAVPVSFIVAGIATVIGGAFINIFSFYTPVSTMATLFLSIAFLSAGGLLTLAGVGLIKLFVKAVKGIINWHGRMITGRPVFEKKVKGKGANAQ